MIETERATFCPTLGEAKEAAQQYANEDDAEVSLRLLSR